MVRDRSRVFHVLILAVTLSVLPSASASAAEKKPQPEMPLCPGQTTTRTALTAPTQATYGPDENRKLALGLTRAVIVAIPAGRIASFTFSAGSPKDENAVVIYDSAFQQLAERGTDPAKGFEPFRYPATAQETDTIVVVSTWAKFRGKWLQTFFRVDAPDEDTPSWTIRAEEGAIISGDYRDMIVNIACE